MKRRRNESDECVVAVAQQITTALTQGVMYSPLPLCGLSTETVELVNQQLQQDKALRRYYYGDLHYPQLIWQDERWRIHTIPKAELGYALRREEFNVKFEIQIAVQTILRGLSKNKLVAVKPLVEHTTIAFRDRLLDALSDAADAFGLEDKIDPEGICSYVIRDVSVGQLEVAFGTPDYILELVLEENSTMLLDDLRIQSQAHLTLDDSRQTAEFVRALQKRVNRRWRCEYPPNPPSCIQLFWRGDRPTEVYAKIIPQ